MKKLSIDKESIKAAWICIIASFLLIVMGIVWAYSVATTFVYQGYLQGIAFLFLVAILGGFITWLVGYAELLLNRITDYINKNFLLERKLNKAYKNLNKYIKGLLFINCPTAYKLINKEIEASETVLNQINTEVNTILEALKILGLASDEPNEESFNNLQLFLFQTNMMNAGVDQEVIEEILKNSDLL